MSRPATGNSRKGRSDFKLSTIPSCPLRIFGALCGNMLFVLPHGSFRCLNPARLRLFENYRFVLYAPFYAAHATGACEAEGLKVELLP